VWFVESYKHLFFTSKHFLFETCVNVRKVLLLSCVNYAVLQTRNYVTCSLASKLMRGY
jgi:hypothetical protein